MILENLGQVLFYLAMAYILYKFLAPVLMEIFSTQILGQKLNQEHDIDELIRKKKIQLDKGQQSAPHHEDIVKKLYSENAKNNDSDTIKILKILNDSQWGESQEIKKWTETLKHKMGVELDNREVFKETLKILAGNYHSELQAISVKELKKVLQFRFITEELGRTDSFYAKILGNKVKVSPSLILKAYNITTHCHIKKMDLKEYLNNVNQQDQVKWQRTELSEKITKMTYLLNISPDELIKETLSNASTLKTMEPITHSENMGLEDALKIFGLKEVPNTKEVIEIKRKELRKIYHPDKICSYTNSKEIEKIATSNYQAIQKAYDIIVKKI